MGSGFERKLLTQTGLVALSLVIAIHQSCIGIASGFLGSCSQLSHGLQGVRHACLLQSTPQNQDFGRDEDNEDIEEEIDLITRDQFYRNLMGRPSDNDGDKKSKMSNSKEKDRKQRPHDNRDQLPFLVQVITPPKEPYRATAAEMQQSRKKKSKKGRRGDLRISEDEDVVIGETLGEFKFDKHTSCGDKIEIDNEVYVVQRSKCQYKYAGAQKFVMVRKVLQVKPVDRAMQEEYILRQWNAKEAPESS